MLEHGVLSELVHPCDLTIRRSFQVGYLHSHTIFPTLQSGLNPHCCSWQYALKIVHVYFRTQKDFLISINFIFLSFARSSFIPLSACLSFLYLDCRQSPFFLCKCRFHLFHWPQCQFEEELFNLSFAVPMKQQFSSFCSLLQNCISKAQVLLTIRSAFSR